MKTIAIIQARMTSSRLPGKIIKDFSNNLNMLDMQLQTLQKILDSKQIYIATTVNAEDDIIETKYQHICNVYRGSEEDVLSRFLDIAKESKAEHIIRIASDNPFIFFEGISHLLNEHYKTDADYTTFSIEDTPSMLVPCGLYVEIIRTNALFEINDKANEIEKEHVTYAIYTRLKEEYRVNLIAVSDYNEKLNNKNFRYTIDTQEDFNFINNIIKTLNITQSINIDVIKNIIDYTQNNHLVEIMQDESNKTKNSKQYNEKKG
ncbi:MAG: hypothetical protein K0U38_11485 [Epsilonproteobacteria bacterium]|nr:hypothetical protein [Campylobacterota bacterium]